MRRIAAHYVWYKQVYRMHYIELDDKGLFCGVFPLDEEIANTSFYDGVVLPISPGTNMDFKLLLKNWEELTGNIYRDSPVLVCRLVGIPLATAKLGTDDGCCDGYVERL